MFTGHNKIHLNYTQPKLYTDQDWNAPYTNNVAHTLIQGTTYIHRAVLFTVLQYTEARAGSKDGTVSDRLTWGLVSTLSHFDLFTIPFVSEKPSQYSQKQFLNVMSYLCQIQVTKRI